MAIKLQIHPSSPSLDLFGPPDQSSTYSLSGHVSLSLSPSHSLFEQRRAIRILLRSLVITFEGQAELITPEAGYFASRLCTVSKELVAKASVELSNEGHEDKDTPCTWHVMFDLPIPGWLPASDSYGDCRQGFSGTQYTLYAALNYTNLEEAYGPGPSWFSSICTPFSSRTKVVHAEAFRMSLNRFALPPPSTSASYPPIFYSVTLKGGAQHPDASLHPVLTDIISKIELLASVPEHISVDGDKFPFTLCIRAPSLSQSEAAKLCITRLSLEPQQIEQYSGSASAYSTRFPIPTSKNQPPNKPLRDAHPVHALYDVGLLATPLQFAVEEVHSLLVSGHKKVDLPLDQGDSARECAEGMHPTKWFQMTVHVPFAHMFSERKDWTSERMGTPRLRATSQGPLFNVKHSMRFGVAFSYDGADGKTSDSASLNYSFPLDFVRLRSAACADTDSLPSHHSLEHLSLSDSSALPATAPPINSYSMPELPAYSQLFHSNGDVRRDDGVPLPLYTPCPTPSHTGEGEHTPSDAGRLPTRSSSLTENTLDRTVIGAAL